MSSYNFHGYFRAKEAVDSMKLLTFYLRTGHRITWQGVVSQLASQPTYLGYTSGTMLGRHMSCQCPVNQNSCLCVYKLSVGISSHPQWHPAETDMKSFSWRTSFHEDCPSWTQVSRMGKQPKILQNYDTCESPYSQHGTLNIRGH